MRTNHIEDIIRTNSGWSITLKSGQIIQCGLNLAEAIEKLDVYPQPELSLTVDLNEPLLRSA